MYVAVKGGEAAISAAHQLLADKRRGNRDVPTISLDQVGEQLSLAVDRVMSEGALYDRELASLAVKQSRGDLIEAVFLTRAYRTTLPRFGYSEAIDTGKMQIERRVSATFKDLPGGQILGPTFDYTHRLLDPSLASDEEPPEALRVDPVPGADPEAEKEPMPRVSDLIAGEGLMEPDSAPPEDGADWPEPGDISRAPIQYPLDRQLRLQALSRGDEGFLLSLGYSTQRGYGRTHPFAGEIRIGEVDVRMTVPELGFDVSLGRIQISECQLVNQFKGSKVAPPQFTRGYGLVFGQSERKAMSMALCDRALRAEELGEDIIAPAQDEEFVISHADNVQATGFVEHLKLPHYVDFQAELKLVRRMQAEFYASQSDASASQAENTEEAAQ
ncbi:alpha-D-ribose 1-methylphosphonate 5-triphosphate synthase subunit PhnI [Cohaesibacter sp. ES.047]|uniref:carbon-phosphorus lyase complex subunit PhnI n=1 Tax=Cohaesibacter sp. ES.047 TaxID=1798205 RepID=UPI000BB859CB|nr:carbon-phosphorus lyase complex subunit PhnI [Cohaesibacter sp. ES.047]SNY92858.1 alpha-D-ribose 1-methylphosphonate 5-triphosphate synthase subunit PhnI [Cohaesibacter sp. ES.047]